MKKLVSNKKEWFFNRLSSAMKKVESITKESGINYPQLT